MTQMPTNLIGETLQLAVPWLTVLALDGLIKKHFSHYALLKIFFLRSPKVPWIRGRERRKRF